MSTEVTERRNPFRNQIGLMQAGGRYSVAVIGSHADAVYRMLDQCGASWVVHASWTHQKPAEEALVYVRAIVERAKALQADTDSPSASLRTCRKLAEAGVWLTEAQLTSVLDAHREVVYEMLDETPEPAAPTAFSIVHDEGDEPDPDPAHEAAVCAVVAAVEPYIVRADGGFECRTCGGHAAAGSSIAAIAHAPGCAHADGTR